MPTAVIAPLKRLWSFVPSGGSLPENVWHSRRRFLVGLTWFHAAIIALAGVLLGYKWDLSPLAIFRHETVLHAVGEGLIVAAFAALGGWRRASRTVQASAIGLGLMSASAILVHLSGGYIEAHFHFFVMLAFLALFQDWIPYLLAVGFVAVHHGVVGVLWPREVFNHAAALNAPWTWAGIHAFFVLSSCIGSVIAWRFTERAFTHAALILEAAGDGIFGLDLAGRIVFINPAAANMLGCDVRRAVSNPVGKILRQVGPDTHAIAIDHEKLLAPVKDGRARHVSDAVFGRADGTSVRVDYVSTPIVERDEITGVVVSFRDITDRKRAEAELQRSHRQLEETLAELKTTQRHVLQQERLRAMGQMASGIAHDFNNTLAPIMGFTELLLKRSSTLDDPQRTAAYLKLIHDAACDAASVVRRLRELYRDRGESVSTTAVDVDRCVESVVALTQPRWKNQALAAGATIQVETDLGQVPPVTGDAADLREVLTNLVLNAVDAMPEGGTITIRTRLEERHARIEIRDTGAGMTEEVRQRCMEPFFSTKGQHGTGLGLSMVNAIIERHAGTCAIESAPGRGTTFIVRLPLYTAGATPVIAAPADSAQRSRRLRILVVEDEPVVRKVITEQLSSDGHTVDSAANGVEGLEKLMSGWFDLVITDRAMPEMGGDQFAATIKRLAPNKPVIMLTGFGDLMSAKGERPDGVRLVVSKPISLDTLREAVIEATAVRADRPDR